jgi:hypothetical protein
MEPDNQIPQPDTDFGDEQFDSTPIKAGRLSGFNEKIFSFMTPKRKPIKQEPIDPMPMYNPLITRAPLRPEVQTKTPTLDPDNNPSGYEIQNGLLFPKKTVAERVRDQLRYPEVMKNIPVTINGLALVIFAVGAYLLYSALPTRPDLILGIILVALAGNVLMNNR